MKKVIVSMSHNRSADSNINAITFRCHLSSLLTYEGALLKSKEGKRELNKKIKEMKEEWKKLFATKVIFKED